MRGSNRKYVSPKFTCWSYHAMSEATQNAIEKIKKNTRHGQKPNFPWKSAIACFVILILARFIIPLPGGSTSTGNIETIYIAVFSFEGAISLGLIAAAQLISQIQVTLIVVFWGRLVEVGFIRNYTGEVDEKGSPIPFLLSKSEKDRYSMAVLTSKNVGSGIVLLLGSIIALPMSIWLSTRWQIAVLVMYLFVVIMTLTSLLWITVLAYFESFTTRVLRTLVVKHHRYEKSKTCPQCALSNRAYLKEMTGYVSTHE
ncbi:hypothetical protein [Alicyclobacillus sp. ALC3]|uniref:hypothetical protein n=1 Tax=Alicyclobacillus sp. ALC3 TaxID=2796143 RepID=UPI002378FB52|nr:hypothetical protein [Alicyclobacillus sp. ALC3]WDL97947.1 hypothetical protein JC200_04320 [Alicyclobacillus sp. ALC3]